MQHKMEDSRSAQRDQRHPDYGSFYIYLEREGLVSWDWHSTTPHIFSSGATWDSPVRRLCRNNIVFLEWRTSLKVKESEKSRGAVEQHADPQSWRSGTVRGMFSCEERGR